MKKGFTLIEILVVSTILVLLAGLMIASYTTLLKSSRDAKRKADFESIRGALEIYRSNNNGAYPSSITFACPPSGSLTDVNGNIYMNPIPNDPKCSATVNYVYASVSPYSTYTLTTTLETTLASYVATPYGSQ